MDIMTRSAQRFRQTNWLCLQAKALIFQTGGCAKLGAGGSIPWETTIRDRTATIGNEWAERNVFWSLKRPRKTAQSRLFPRRIHCSGRGGRVFESLHSDQSILGFPGVPFPITCLRKSSSRSADRFGTHALRLVGRSGVDQSIHLSSVFADVPLSIALRRDCEDRLQVFIEARRVD
ncbi:hypothetical protein J2857_003129 [Neorhizobium galegae]|nr:hypothetical protein [Neorhizobium galegae]